MTNVSKKKEGNAEKKHLFIFFVSPPRPSHRHTQATTHVRHRRHHSLLNWFHALFAQ